jgi:hypothetical protein
VPERGSVASIAQLLPRCPCSQRLESSQPWIVAGIDPASKSEDGSAWINVEVVGVGVPCRFNEFVHVFAEGKTDRPIASISVFGEITRGRPSAERLFWSLTDKRRVGALVCRRLRAVCFENSSSLCSSITMVSHSPNRFGVEPQELVEKHLTFSSWLQGCVERPVDCLFSGNRRKSCRHHSICLGVVSALAR